MSGLATLGTHPEGADGNDRRRRARRSPLGAVGSLPLPVHGAAVLDRERAAEDRCSSPAPARREGKSITVAGHRPALRDHGAQGAADRRRSAQSVAAQEARARQLHRSQQLSDRRPARRPRPSRRPPIANLAFMASGPLPPNAADLLASPRLHSLLSVGLEVFDLIVIDGPPVMGLADAPAAVQRGSRPPSSSSAPDRRAPASCAARCGACSSPAAPSSARC